MNERGAGTIFCLIASLLFSERYITAAIFLSNTGSWDNTFFAKGLEYQGDALLNFSIISLIIGIIYLVWSEIDERKG